MIKIFKSRPGCQGPSRKFHTVDLTKPTGLPPDYAELLESLKARVRQAQTQAMLSVNRELIRLYWEIGREIVQRQEQANWGWHMLERLAEN